MALYSSLSAGAANPAEEILAASREVCAATFRQALCGVCLAGIGFGVIFGVTVLLIVIQTLVATTGPALPPGLIEQLPAR